MRLPTRQDGVENRDKVYWRKDDEKYNPHLICSRSERKISLSFYIFSNVFIIHELSSTFEAKSSYCRVATAVLKSNLIRSIWPGNRLLGVK